MNFKLPGIFRKLLIALLFALIFVSIFDLVWKYSGLRSKEQGFPDGILQVLVITPEEVEIIHFQSDLDAYLKSHPDYSFLIPPGQEKQFNEKLSALYHQKYRERGIDAYPRVKVERIGEGRQYVEVGLGGRREQTVWYEDYGQSGIPALSPKF